MKMRDRRLSVPFVVVGLLASCGGQTPAPAPEAQEPPTVAVTIWTDQTELFMEYPPLVAGRESRGWYLQTSGGCTLGFKPSDREFRSAIIAPVRKGLFDPGRKRRLRQGCDQRVRGN